MNAILRSSPRPADPDPVPVLPHDGLTPPPAAPIVVGEGATEGWTWMLSASADGTCVAFTDQQGSETTCSEPDELVGEDGTIDVVDVQVRGPQAPAPPLLFFFGRVPPAATRVEVNLSTFEQPEGELFAPPDGMDVAPGYYVQWVRGLAYPYLPEGVRVWAYDAQGNSVGARPQKDEGAELERPIWAQTPTFTTLERITSGHSDLGDGRDWEIAVFRNEATGLVCLGEPGSISVCGPPGDPAPGWVDGLAVLCARYPSIACGPTLQVIGGEGGGPVDGGVVSFGWGVFTDPVATVRVERYTLTNGFSSASERNGWVETDVFEVPARYGAQIRVFAYSCACLSGEAVGFDAGGNEVARSS